MLNSRKKCHSLQILFFLVTEKICEMRLPEEIGCEGGVKKSREIPEGDFIPCREYRN